MIKDLKQERRAMTFPGDNAGVTVPDSMTYETTAFGISTLVDTFQ